MMTRYRNYTKYVIFIFLFTNKCSPPPPKPPKTPCIDHHNKCVVSTLLSYSFDKTHLFEKVVLREQVSFRMFASTVVRLQHLHSNTGQTWIRFGIIQIQIQIQIKNTITNTNTNTKHCDVASTTWVKPGLSTCYTLN